MSFSFRRAAALLSSAVLGAIVGTAGAEECCGDLHPQAPAPGYRDPHILRITADPNNLPFSNERSEGFENKIAELIAQELGMTIQWNWRAQRRGFFRETLKESTADLVLGAPAGYERALTTKPYYRSTYVFVTRKEAGLNVASLDDPRLRDLKIGIQLVGDDGVNTPPAHALARRGIINNVKGYTLYGDYTQPNPPARVIDAVASGEVDVAIAWGPLAGYFARHSPVPLEVTPVSPAEDPPLRFVFGIAMGVRKKDSALRDQVERVLIAKQAQIEKILDDYGVPRVAAASRPATEAHHP